MVRLSQLVHALGGTCRPAPGGAADREIVDVHIDSRRVGRGELFAALPGQRVDGARFVPAALERGAAAVLSPARVDVDTDGDAPNWVHPHARSVVGEAAAMVHAHPARAQRVLGITGTNGKTTTAYFAGTLLRHAQLRPAVIGTVGYRLWGAEPQAATHTTPDATELQRLLKNNLANGGDAFVAEVSSHALDQERVSGLELDVAVFLNLSRDHIDYHGSLDAYGEAKARIFGLLKRGGAAVVNADDAYAPRMIAAAREAGARVVTFGTGSRCDLCASRVSFGLQGIDLFLDGMGILKNRLHLPLVGRHNLENALAASAATLLMGASPSRVLEGLATVSPPPGRLEEVDAGGRGFQVFVDYAHTPDALEGVLASLRAGLSGGARLLVVFGCGGDRDQGKRAPMGGIAARLADVAVITSDNPRSEDPASIVDEVASGASEVSGGRAEILRIVERRAAIRRALELAREGDVVLIAGKGHETWQERLGQRLPFDDRAVVRDELHP